MLANVLERVGISPLAETIEVGAPLAYRFAKRVRMHKNSPIFTIQLVGQAVILVR